MWNDFNIIDILPNVFFIENMFCFQSMDPDSSYIPDVYDELLTQAELQGYINLVNCTCIEITQGLIIIWQLGI